MSALGWVTFGVVTAGLFVCMGLAAYYLRQQARFRRRVAELGAVLPQGYPQYLRRYTLGLVLFAVGLAVVFGLMYLRLWLAEDYRVMLFLPVLCPEVVLVLRDVPQCMMTARTPHSLLGLGYEIPFARLVLRGCKPNKKNTKVTVTFLVTTPEGKPDKELVLSATPEWFETLDAAAGTFRREKLLGRLT